MPLLTFGTHRQPHMGPPGPKVCISEQHLCDAVLAQQETLNAQSSPGGLENDNTHVCTQLREDV